MRSSSIVSLHDNVRKGVIAEGRSCIGGREFPERDEKEKREADAAKLQGAFPATVGLSGVLKLLFKMS
jgi:hypothetical protein